MTRSIKKLCWASMASAVMMTVASCEKTDPQPEDKQEPPTSVTKRTVKYDYVRMSAMAITSNDIHMFFFRDENDKPSAYESRKAGTYKIKYLGDGDLFSETNKAELDGGIGTHIAGFKANGREFMVYKEGDTTILKPANNNSLIDLEHNAGNRDIPVSAVTDFGNRLVKKMPELNFVKP